LNSRGGFGCGGWFGFLATTTTAAQDGSCRPTDGAHSNLLA
jgi:hypothetical protein